MGWTLLIEGVAQSYVDLNDPRHLEFPYVRRVASALDALPAPEQVLHLGAGGMTIPRYLSVRFPEAEQLVIERDAGLILLVHEWLPLPDGSRIEVRIDRARPAVETALDDAYDLIIGDAYDGATMPRDMTSVEYAREVARILRPNGTYVVNVTDLPALTFTRIQAATLRTVFPDVCVLADASMLRGRKFGNVILVASPVRRTLRPRAMAQPRRGETSTARIIHGRELTEFISGAQPTTDADSADF